MRNSSASASSARSSYLRRKRWPSIGSAAWRRINPNEGLLAPNKPFKLTNKFTMNTKENLITPVTRRHFLKNSTLFAATAAAVTSFPNILHAQTKPKLNAAVIGLGGRGSGAAKDFLDAAKEVGVEANIVALADLVPDQISKCRQNLSRLGVEVPTENCFRF